MRTAGQTCPVLPEQLSKVWAELLAAEGFRELLLGVVASLTLLANFHNFLSFAASVLHSQKVCKGCLDSWRSTEILLLHDPPVWKKLCEFGSIINKAACLPLKKRMEGWTRTNQEQVMKLVVRTRHKSYEGVHYRQTALSPKRDSAVQ